jgi:predicted acetyltransferase
MQGINSNAILLLSMQLISPSIDYKREYLAALAEGKGESTLTRLDVPSESESFVEFVQRLLDYGQGLQLPKEYVSSTELWLVDNEQFIGRVSIRHELTEHLLKEGGHIGYYIRPSKRNLGYGKQILALALLEARKLGLTKVLVTCDDDNIGSRKIIEVNGGILENIVDSEPGKPSKRRYWITL